MAKPTTAQLRNGAIAIAYRTEHLTMGVVTLARSDVFACIPSPFDIAVQNALVESILSHARGLAYFLTDTKDVRVSMYETQWQDDALVRAARFVEEPVSRHSSHATKGRPEGEGLPGAWPLAELASVLVPGVAAAVESMPETQKTWFQPEPSACRGLLHANRFAAVRTPRSDNPSVAALTEALQGYLDNVVTPTS